MIAPQIRYELYNYIDQDYGQNTQNHLSCKGARAPCHCLVALSAPGSVESTTIHSYTITTKLCYKNIKVIHDTYNDQSVEFALRTSD